MILTGWETEFYKNKQQYFELFEEVLTQKQEVDVSFLEESIKKLTGRKHVILCASGTDALHFSLRALERYGLVKGGHVLVPDFSWISSASCAPMAGLVPVFCDVDLDTYHMSVDTVDKAMRKMKPGYVGAIVFPHLFGNMTDTTELETWCKERDIFFIEDACQAIGASYRGKPAGTSGIISTFSFNANKNIAGIAGGGAILTDEDDLADFCRKIAVHGKGEMLGYNSKMLLLNAKVIDHRLKSLKEWQYYRQRYAEMYDDALNDLIVHIQKDKYVDHSYHKYVVRFHNKKTRDKIQKLIGGAVHYDKPISENKIWEIEKCVKTDTPNATLICDTILTLPLHHYIDFQEIISVSNTINEHGN